MAPLIKEDPHRYDSLDIDLENDELDNLDHMDNDNDSETTLASDGFLHKNHSKRISRYENSSRLLTILTWSRWGIIVFLQGIIIMLLLPTSGVLTEEGWNLGSLTGGSSSEMSGWDAGKTETGGDVNGLYVPMSHKYALLTPEEEKFVPNMSTDANRMEIRKNWDMLMPLGSGSVLIPDYEQHPLLGKPIVTDPIHKGPVFEASWTHALHCLYYTVDSYHQLVISNGTKFGFEGERNDYHAAHCFEYLRNQIMCMADMTLEGSESVLDATGEGQAHMCRNREEAVAWIEARRLDDIKSIVGPAPVTEKI